MKNSTLIKLFTGLVVMIFIIVAILNHRKPAATETPQDDLALVLTPDRSASSKPLPVLDPEAGGTERPKLSREQVEAWLKLHGRDAMSLLAAFRALDDPNYLNEAAAAFPNDPRVQWTVLARDAFPADRRKWLELYKQSSPDNSVAFYLSAEDYFKNGRPDEATKELLLATDKYGFDNYENESRVTSEDLYAFLGKSKLEAAQMSLAAITTDMLSTLSAYKRVGQGLAELQKKALVSGDMDSVEEIYDMGTTLVDNLQEGDGGNYLINHLAGIAAQNLLLAQLAQKTRYDFLDDQTPAQMLQELKEQKDAITKLFKSFNALYPSLTPEELLDYNERVKDDGELEAIQWVVEQHSSVPGN